MNSNKNLTVQPSSAKWTYAQIAALAIIGIAFSIGLYNWCSQLEKNWLREEFIQNSINLSMNIDRSKNVLLNLLKSTNHSEVLQNKSDFDTFAQNAIKQNPALLEVCWIPEIQWSERQFFEDQATQLLGNNYSILQYNETYELVSAAVRDVYSPIYFRYPHRETSIPLGIDLNSLSNVFVHTISHDQDITIINPTDYPDIKNWGNESTLLALIKTQSKTIQYNNPFRKVLNIENQSTKRNDGFILAKFNLPKLVLSVSNNDVNVNHLDFILIDNSNPEEQKLLYTSKGDPSTILDSIMNGFDISNSWSSTIQAGNHKWLLLSRPSQDFVNNKQYLPTRIILKIGIIITLLICLYLIILNRHTLQIENLANQLSKSNNELKDAQIELKESHEKLLKAEKLKTAQDMAEKVVQEFRQPMTTLFLIMNLMDEGDSAINSKKIRHFIIESFERLGSLLNQLSNLTTLNGEESTGQFFIDPNINHRSNTQVAKVKKILIIEDEILLAEALKVILKSMKYDIEIVSTSDNGMDKIKENKYDVIFCDINLPGNRNGVDIAIDSQEHLKETRFIFMSGFPVKESWNTIIKNSGGFLLKPFTIEDVKKILLVV